MILIDIPVDESDASSAHYSTIPLGIILLDNTIVTICTAQTKILNDFIVGHVKNFLLSKKLDLFFKYFIRMQAIIYIILEE
ncbi:putative magnesium and cobalt transporter [[Clostridium] sordellii ATCC 9714]|nr:putative magnesium and cobalt transporter [[Clostridium] sordellii ATCC 9714] [Paeniclostridium sordellii ATCC 9714]